MSVNPVIYQKKRGHGLLIFLIILLVIILLPIALAYILIYDGSTKDIKYKEGSTMSEYMASFKDHLLVNSIDKTSTTGNISLALKEENLNNLLYYGFNEALNATVKQYLNKAYIDIDANGKQYNFYIDASTPFFPFFKTRAQLCATISNFSTGLGFEMKITDAKIGRVGGLLGIVDHYVTQEMMENVFSSTGLSFKVDWKKHTISYSADDLLKDFGLSSAGDNLFTTLVKDIFSDNEGLIDLDFYTDKSISINVDLSSAHNANAPAPVSFAQTIAQIKNEFKTKVISSTNEISDRFIEIAEGNHEKPTSSSDLTTILNQRKSVVNKSTYITEEEINDYLRGTDLIGKSYPLYVKDEDTNENTINFIIIDDFYCDILSDNNIKFYIDLNINGYTTQMSVEATIGNHIKKSGSNYTLNFQMSDFKYGNVISMWDSVNDKPKKIVSDLMEEGFSVGGESSNIQINGKDIEIVLGSDAEIYSLSNEITTSTGEEDRLNVQVFMPQFNYGHGAPTGTANEGDMYFDQDSFKFYVYTLGSWGVGQDVTSPAWQAANQKKVDLLKELGLIP